MQNSIKLRNLSNLYSPLNRTLTAKKNQLTKVATVEIPEIMLISSYPPRECGIATYTQDLIKALNNKFNYTFNIKVCALESSIEQHKYPADITHILNINYQDAFSKMAYQINKNNNIKLVLLQHEFGLFHKKEAELLDFLHAITKPIATVFHTVLPNPNPKLRMNVIAISKIVSALIVMTQTSKTILQRDYEIDASKITVIEHGTHLVPYTDKEKLKRKFGLEGKEVLATFGLLSAGKNIETTLDALPSIIQINKNVTFLILGKTHPSIVANEGECYREMLEKKVDELELRNHVRFINSFIPLPILLEYLQLTDIYLFTSKDPNQAVSGTFSYAISCGCPIISTAIPHAQEVLKKGNGILIDFENPVQLSNAVNHLLNDKNLRQNISSNGIHRMAPTAWENAAIAHALLFQKISNVKNKLHYSVPAINLDHIKKMTTDFGILQFSVINNPDKSSGYTLDDNARALISFCQYYEISKDTSALHYIEIYQKFIAFCLQNDNNFLNYVDIDKKFTNQNTSTNLQDSNGRAIWALGYLLSIADILPNKNLILNAKETFKNALLNASAIHSTRAMAFIIKGIYYANINLKEKQHILLLEALTNRLVQMYHHESDDQWKWYESYLTYANSLLPEALLCAWMATGKKVYKEIAKSSFDFLLSKIFITHKIKVISNKNWLQKNDNLLLIANGGEQPIDVAYTILALGKFYQVFKDETYFKNMKNAFNWFLGANHLHQIMYNPCTGGCYDGLEEDYINLNQGAESTISYLMARITIETPAHFKNEYLKMTPSPLLKNNNIINKECVNITTY